MPDKIVDRNALFTPAEAAELLRVAPVTVRSWAQKGWLNAEVTAGGHRRFSTSALIGFAAERGLTLHWSGRHKSRVLIVEDDVQLASYLYELLGDEQSNLEVESVHNGFEAGLQMMVFKPDVVLLDLMMPGLDGFAVCERIKQDPVTRSVRVIAMTGFPTSENLSRIKKLGAETCLSKPFSTEELFDALNLHDAVAEL